MNGSVLRQQQRCRAQMKDAVFVAGEAQLDDSQLLASAWCRCHQCCHGPYDPAPINLVIVTTTTTKTLTSQSCLVL